jgi:hypothetical protein
MQFFFQIDDNDGTYSSASDLTANAPAITNAMVRNIPLA